MSYTISVNENLQKVNANTVKGIVVGPGIITITSGELTKTFNINVKDYNMLNDITVESGEGSDGDITIDPAPAP